MYAEVSEDFNTKYDTWIIAFCPDTDTFFATNERHFFWESPNEFATEDEAIRNFALDTLYYILVRNKLMSSMFYGTINVDYKVFLENTKQWYYVSLSLYKTIFRDYQIMRKNRVTCANCIIENYLGKRKCCEQCENRYNEIDFYSMKTLIEKMNTLLEIRYYRPNNVADLFYHHTEKYISIQSAIIALKNAGLALIEYNRAVEILRSLPGIAVTIERVNKDNKNKIRNHYPKTRGF